MRTLLQINLAIVLLWSLAVNAQVKWNVVPMENNRFILENMNNKSLRHEIRSQGSTPRYMGLHRVNKQDVVLLIYFSGSSGTSDVVDIYRTLVFNTKSKKFYGDFPFRVESALPGKSWPDTVFTFKKHHFMVSDPNTGLKKTIKY